MEKAPPASTSAHLFSAPPPGYQALGTATTIEKDASKVCLRAGSATVEVIALAPDSPEGKAAKRALDSLQSAHPSLGGSQKPGT